MPEYDTSDWVRPSPCLMPAPPPHVGVGKLDIGLTYPTMIGYLVKIVDRVKLPDGIDYYQGIIQHPSGSTFYHYFELNGRDWTGNPNNIYAIDWPTVDTPKRDSWGRLVG